MVKINCILKNIMVLISSEKRKKYFFFPGYNRGFPQQSCIGNTSYWCQWNSVEAQGKLGRLCYGKVFVTNFSNSVDNHFFKQYIHCSALFYFTNKAIICKLWYMWSSTYVLLQPFVIFSIFFQIIDLDDWQIHVTKLKYFSYYLTYRKTSNIRRTLVGNKIVDHSDVVGASPVGAAPTTSSFST